MTSLFDSVEIWETNPILAFSSFIKSDEYLLLARRKPPLDVNGRPHRPVHDSTARNRIYLFSRFADWYQARGKTIYSVQPEDIRAFLDDPGAARVSSIRNKYISILERVFNHLDITPNPASRTWFDLHSLGRGGKDRISSVIVDDEIASFMRALPEAEAFDPDLKNFGKWKIRRDRAILAMLVGAGMKQQEVINIHTENVGKPDSTGTVPITVTARSTQGSSLNHIAHLHPAAAREVRLWVAERLLIGIRGPYLFPSTVTKGEPIDRTRVYRAVKETCVRAGLNPERIGARLLRNTYAVKALNEGKSVEEVGLLMGMRTRKGIQKYVSLPHVKNKMLRQRNI